MSISTITINAVNYTAYASVAEADAYLAVDPSRSAGWAALTDDQKGANLVAATRRLDLLKFSGEKVGGQAQQNQWPRTGATCDGEAVDTGSDVPTDVENATILMAGSITLDATNADAGTSGSNIKSVGAGSARVEFFRPTIPGAALQDETVYNLLRCWLSGSAAAASLFGLASGTDGTSEFCDVNSPALNDGYA